MNTPRTWLVFRGRKQRGALASAIYEFLACRQPARRIVALLADSVLRVRSIVTPRRRVAAGGRVASGSRGRR